MAPFLVVGEALLTDELSRPVGGGAKEQAQRRLVHPGDGQDDLGGAVGVAGLGAGDIAQVAGQGADGLVVVRPEILYLRPVGRMGRRPLLSGSPNLTAGPRLTVASPVQVRVVHTRRAGQAGRTECGSRGAHPAGNDTPAGDGHPVAACRLCPAFHDTSHQD